MSAEWLRTLLPQAHCQDPLLALGFTSCVTLVKLSLSPIAPTPTLGSLHRKLSKTKLSLIATR